MTGLKYDATEWTFSIDLLSSSLKAVLKNGKLVAVTKIHSFEVEKTYNRMQNLLL